MVTTRLTIDINFGLNQYQATEKLERNDNRFFLTPQVLTRKGIPTVTVTYWYKSTNLLLNCVSLPHQHPASLLAFWKQQRQQWNLAFVLRIMTPRLWLQRLVRPVENRRAAPCLLRPRLPAPRNQSPSQVRASLLWFLPVTHSNSPAAGPSLGACLYVTHCLKAIVREHFGEKMV